MGHYKDESEFELDVKTEPREFVIMNVGTEELQEYGEMVDIWIDFLKQKGIYEEAINRSSTDE